MSFRSKGLLLALEDDAPLVNVEINAEQETAAEIEADAAGLQEDASEVDDLSTATEQAGEDLDTLSEISDVMQESVDSGEGLDPVAARMAAVSVESISQRLFRGNNFRLIPALESFGDEHSRVTATNMAIENISDIVKRGVDAIRKAFSLIMEKIRGFIQRLIDANKKHEAAFDSIYKKSQAVKDSDLKEKTFKDQSLCEATLSGGKMSYEVMTDILKDQISLTGSLVKAGNTIMTSGVQAVSSIKNAGVAGVKEGMSNFANAVAKAVTVNGNGKYIRGTVLTIKREDTPNGIAKLVVEVNKDPRHKATTDVCETLLPGEIRDLSKLSLSLCKEIDTLKAVIKELGDMEKNFNTLFGQIEQIAAKNNLTVQDIKTPFLQVGSAAQNLYVQVPSLAIQTNKASLDYLKKSMAQYSGAFDAAKDYAQAKYADAKSATKEAYGKAENAAKGAYDKAKNAFGKGKDGEEGKPPQKPAGYLN